MMMDAILAQLQLLNKSPPQGCQDNTTEGPSGCINKNIENDRSKDKEEGTGSH